MTKSLLSAAVLAVLSVSAAHAASFDCTRAQRPVEKLICGIPRLNAADGRLGDAYRSGLQRLPPTGVGPLRADQVQWLSWIQEVCHAPEPDPPHSLVARPAASAGNVAACMLPLYDERTKQLRNVTVERDNTRFLMRTQYLAAPEPELAAMNGPGFPGFGTLRASWPLALSDAPEWAAWNRAAEAAAYAMAAEDTWSIGKTNSGTPQWTPSLAEEADTEVTVHVLRVEHGRVTSAVAMNTMGHPAAHPSESSGTMTWLLQAGRPLRAEDVFAPGDAWKKMVAEACWTAIHRGEKKAYVYPEVAGPDAEQLQGAITDVGNWTLEHDGLHISYPEYSVSPRYAGMDDTVIPWTTLQAVLVRGFVAP